MNSKQLKYFVTVTEEGTVSSAAKKLFISQPPISQQIKLLEDELGTKLFIRTPRQMILTTAGKLLYNRAKSIISMTNMAKDEVTSFVRDQRNTIKIGIISSIIGSEILQKIASFATDREDINFEFYESDTYAVIDNLHKEHINFGIVRSPFPLSKFKTMKLQNSRLVALGHKNIFNNKMLKLGNDTLETENRTYYLNDKISLNELSKYPLIIYRRWENLILDTFKKYSMDYIIKCRTDSASTALFLARRGAGLALLPSTIVSSNMENIIVMDIVENPWPSDVYIIYDDLEVLSRECIDFFNYMVSKYEKNI